MIDWNKIQRKNPLNKQLAWYPTICLKSTVAFNDVIVGIVEKCTLTKMDVQAVLIALEEVIIEQLKNGNSVRFGNLGSFAPTLQTRFWNEEKGAYGTGGCEVPTTIYDEDGKVVALGVTSDNIAGLSVTFRKSAEMTAKLNRSQLKFKMVEGEKRYPIKG